MRIPVLALVGCFAGLFSLRAADSLPPEPAHHFNDYTGTVSLATAQTLDRRLAQFERDSSDQIVVAIFAHLPEGEELQDYTHRVAQSWGLGLKGKDNGAALFIFKDDHRMRIEVNYGLEPRLTDATCKDIEQDVIAPRFRTGDFDGGVTAGVNAMLAAAQGEYQGTGRTVDEERHGGNGGFNPAGLALIFFVMIVASYLRSRRQVNYTGQGRGGHWGGGGPWIFPGGWGGGGWGGGSGGGGGGWGGGFSGGGGSGGGGGASGSW